MYVPQYFVKILERDDTVVAAPLEVAGVEFTQNLFVPGQEQMETFVLTLKDMQLPNYLLTAYNSLDYEQRIEIYENADLLGDPVFTGVIMELPSDLNNTQEVRGEGILRRLDARRLRRYHSVDDNAVAIIKDFLKTYEVVFKDNFNRTTGIGSDWTVTAGSWNITSNYLHTVSGATRRIETTTSHGRAVWDGAKISFDYRRIGTGNDSGVRYPHQDADNSLVLGIAFDKGTGIEQFRLGKYIDGVYTISGDRYITLTALNVWNHIDIYTSKVGTGTRVVVVLNGTELFNLVQAGTSGFTGPFAFGGSVADFDNFVLMQKTDALVPGSYGSTSTGFDQVLNAETQYEAINWLVEALDWEYRVIPKAGKGKDQLDFNTSVGSDLSALVRLEEGKNIEALSRRRTSENLATSLYVYGQVQDDVSANLVVHDLNAFDNYGIIEGEYHDPQVVDVTTARLLANNRIAISGAGNVSLSGRIRDETYLLEQDPRWGYAPWGDFVWGGRKRLRVGDDVWLKVPRWNIDRKVRIVSIHRRAGDSAIDVTFDYFAWRQQDRAKWLKRAYAKYYRQYLNRMNTLGTIRLDLVGTTAQTLSLYLRGFITAVFLDVRSGAWAGAVSVSIDGTDRTSALGGGSGWGADFHVTDTAFLAPPGEHTITFTPTQTVTIFVTITGKTLS